MDLESLRPRLDAAALRQDVAGPGRPWRYLEVVDETGSTNADLIARAAAGDDIAGAVLIAEHQTAGRGRSGRTWVDAPRALIAMSVGISAAGVMPQAWGWVPLAAGVAVVDAVSATTGIQARLKWPNDVLVDEHKLAGILAEVASPQPFIVLGIGLNVTLRPDEISEPGATSLLSLGADVDRNTLTCILLTELAKRLTRWRDTGDADSALTADYRARSVTIGSRVRAQLPGDAELVGDAVGVDERGRLCIDTGDAVVAVSAGDIIHLRPASG
jgi:BirA family transcriptional regulator, biotin operon repressor / biotin---[acetyl-CoA-carboxylase] ligase